MKNQKFECNKNVERTFFLIRLFIPSQNRLLPFKHAKKP